MIIRRLGSYKFSRIEYEDSLNQIKVFKFGINGNRNIESRLGIGEKFDKRSLYK